MCPVCVGAAAWVISSALTGSGAALISVRSFRQKRDSKAPAAQYGGKQRRHDHGKRNNEAGSTQSGNAE